jgi:hypothetical protein
MKDRLSIGIFQRVLLLERPSMKKEELKAIIKAAVDQHKASADRGDDRILIEMLADALFQKLPSASALHPRTSD